MPTNSSIKFEAIELIMHRNINLMQQIINQLQEVPLDGNCNECGESLKVYRQNILDERSIHHVEQLGNGMFDNDDKFAIAVLNGSSLIGGDRTFEGEITYACCGECFEVYRVGSIEYVDDPPEADYDYGEALPEEDLMPAQEWQIGAFVPEPNANYVIAQPPNVFINEFTFGAPAGGVVFLGPEGLPLNVDHTELPADADHGLFAPEPLLIEPDEALEQLLTEEAEIHLQDNS